MDRKVVRLDLRSKMTTVVPRTEKEVAPPYPVLRQKGRNPLTPREGPS